MSMTTAPSFILTSSVSGAPIKYGDFGDKLPVKIIKETIHAGPVAQIHASFVSLNVDGLGKAKVAGVVQGAA